MISQSGKSFHLFIFTNFDVLLVMNFLRYTGHGFNLFVNLLESTGSVLEFYIVKTSSLFDVFFKGYIAEVED